MQRDPEGGLFEGCTLAKLAETGSGYGVDGTRSVPEPVLEQKRLYATAVSLLLLSLTHPTNTTTAIINRICFMPATLRHQKGAD